MKDSKKRQKKQNRNSTSSRVTTTKSHQNDQQVRQRRKSQHRQNVDKDVEKQELKNIRWWHSIKNWWLKLKKWQQFCYPIGLLILIVIVILICWVLIANKQETSVDIQQKTEPKPHTSVLVNITTESPLTTTSNRICPEEMHDKCDIYFYDESFLQENPSQALLVMTVPLNNSQYNQTGCFGTFVDFYPYEVTAIFTAAHCHNKTAKEYIIEIIYYDQKLKHVALTSIEQFKVIEHPSIKLKNISFKNYPHLHGEINYDIALLLSNVKLPVKAAKLPTQGHKRTGTYISPKFYGNYNNLKMINVTLVESRLCTENYKSKGKRIITHEKNQKIVNKMDQRDLQICVNRGAGITLRGQSGSSLLELDGQDVIYFLGEYSSGPITSILPHLYVTPGSLQDILKTFKITQKMLNLAELDSMNEVI